MHPEELINKYEAMGGAELFDDLRVAHHRNLPSGPEGGRRVDHERGVVDEIGNYAERKRKVFGNDLKAMEADQLADVYN
jgi:hypothetical protein